MKLNLMVLFQFWRLRGLWGLLYIRERQQSRCIKIYAASFLSLLSPEMYVLVVRESQKWTRCTHLGGTVRFFCEISLPFCFILPGSKFFLVYIIFRTLTQILVVTPFVYTFHIDMHPFSMSPTEFTRHFHRETTCVLFTWGNTYASYNATHATYTAC